MGDERKLGAEVREVGCFLVTETARLRLMFAPEKKRSLVGAIRVVNTSTNRNYVDRFNLGVGPRRKAFIKEAVTKIELSYGEIEALLDEFVEKLTHQATPSAPGEPPRIEIPDVERQWGEAFLRNKNLVGELLEDFKTLGCVGEETNLLTCYLVATSRLLPKPLSAIITSQSGSGKSTIMNAVMGLISEPEKLELTRISPSALYYLPEGRLKHKVVSIAEETGASGACYSLRSLMSDGHLTLAVTMRDPRTGQMVAIERKSEGPSAVLSTTTVPQMGEETWLRVLRLATNETVEQTREILRRQREEGTIEGLRQKVHLERIRKKHHAAQSLLKQTVIMNPYAKEMTFREDLMRVRRENEKYLKLIYSVALLRQQQKEVREVQVFPDTAPQKYILISLDDIEVANQIAEVVLSRTLDELTPPARNLLVEVCAFVRRHCAEQGLSSKDYRFTRRQLREFTKWSDFQIRYYMKELEELEYVAVHRGSQGAGYVYELVFDGDPQAPDYTVGLVDAAKLREKYSNGNGSRLLEFFQRGRGQGAKKLELSTTSR